MTIAEKILARASGKSRVVPNDFVTAKIDLAMMPSGPTTALRTLAKSGIAEKDFKIWDPEKLVAATDHGAPRPRPTLRKAKKGCVKRPNTA